ncbi:unnamed protein product [Discula destructiva]
MNTPPADTDETNEEASPLHGSFANIKPGLVSGEEDVLLASWERLLIELRVEVDAVTQPGAETIPVIQFEDLSIPTKADPFLKDLQTRGAAIIRNVISEDEAAAWTHELDNYLRDNPHTKASPPDEPELYELFWSLAQLNARAHHNVLAAQKHVMRGCWHRSRDTREVLSTRFPVAYADRVRMTHRSLRGSRPRGSKTEPPGPAMTGVDRHNVDGQRACGSGACLECEGNRIWSGNLDDHDPWDSDVALERRSALHDAQSADSTVFKMFLGILPLSVGSADDDPPMLLCRLPLKLTTAYRLLRPLFSPKRALTGSLEEFLHPSNWALDSAGLGTRPRQAQETRSILYPHLELDKTLMPIPPLNSGDYVIWHPDTIHTQATFRPNPTATIQSLSPLGLQSSHRSRAPKPPIPPPHRPTTTLHLPCCPLTLANAAYLANQRRAFILGLAAPDFAVPVGTGESYHMGRPGVQEVSDAGGEEALRAMGLLAWDENEAVDEGERSLLEAANAVLFPDRSELGREAPWPLADARLPDRGSLKSGMDDFEMG